MRPQIQGKGGHYAPVIYRIDRLGKPLEHDAPYRYIESSETGPTTCPTWTIRLNDSDRRDCYVLLEHWRLRPPSW